MDRPRALTLIGSLVSNLSHGCDKTAFGNQTLTEETNEFDNHPIPYDYFMEEIYTSEDS